MIYIQGVWGHKRSRRMYWPTRCCHIWLPQQVHLNDNLQIDFMIVAIKKYILESLLTGLGMVQRPCRQLTWVLCRKSCSFIKLLVLQCTEPVQFPPRGLPYYNHVTLTTNQCLISETFHQLFSRCLTIASLPKRWKIRLHWEIFLQSEQMSVQNTIVALVKVNTYNGSAVFNIYCSASDFPRVSRRPQKNLNLLKCDKTENQIAYNRILDNVFVSSQLICSGNSQPDTTTFPSVSFLETEADFFKWLVSMNILFLMKIIYKYIKKNV